MSELLKIHTMAELAAQNKKPEILFWVGCAGSFDDRAKKVTRAFAEILQKANIDFAIMGNEENCTGDPARRSGNEFLFQMQATVNIEMLNQYEIKTIVTACPHCFNTLKNEYPALGGSYEVIHHTQYIHQLLESGKIAIQGGEYKGKKITYHDSCYLGRANDIYEIPRSLIEKLDANLVEMKSAKKNGLCCGAGGAQMFKEPEKGTQDINIKRTEEAIETNAEIVAVACPFCMTMLTDGITAKEKKESVKVMDFSELILSQIQ